MPYIGKSLGNGVRQRYIYVATAGQTSFSGNDSAGISLAYDDPSYLDVYQNGVLLKPVTDYASTTGTSVVLVTGATTDDVIEMITYDTFAIADTVSAKDGGAFAGAVSMASTLAVTGAQTNSSTISGTIITGSTSLKTPLIESSNGTDALAINTAGFVSQSQLVAFHADTIAATGNANYLTFTNEVTDTASAYNVSNGTFTVPANAGGTYLFYASINYDKNSSSDTDTNYVILEMRKNDSEVASFISHYYGRGDYDYVAGQLAITLAAADTMRIYNNGNATTIGGAYSHFNGFRIG